MQTHLLATLLACGLLSVAPSSPQENAHRPLTGDLVEESRQLARTPLPPSIAEHPALSALYTFVGSHLELMTQVRCFCGCDAIGHGSTADCFVERIKDSADVTWSKHATGCGMCLAIARDAMQLQEQKVAAAEIARQLDAKYKPAGPTRP
jgi:NAD(P)H-nitrite reductase large subunit